MDAHTLHVLGRCATLWLAFFAAATVFAEPETRPPATFAAPPPRAVPDAQVLPDGWPYARSLETAAAPPSTATPVRRAQAVETTSPLPARTTGDPLHGNHANGDELTGVFNLREENWWGIFRDPELDRLENLALAANQDLQRAGTRIVQSRLQARVVAADLFPQLEARLQSGRSALSDDNGLVRTGPIRGPGPTGTARLRAVTENDFEGQLRLDWEVDVFGRIRAAYASRQARAQAALADARGVRLSVTTELADDYFALRTADEQVAILIETLGYRSESLSLNEARTRAGIGNPDDVSRAELEFHNVEATLADARRQRHSLEANLALLCGQPAPDFRVGVRLARTASLPDAPRLVPAILLTRRPDVAAAERQLAATLQDIRVARAEELPKVTVTGYLGQQSESASRFTDNSSHEASILPVITVPVFEGGRNDANVRLARARRDEAAADYRETVLTAFREADTALDDLRLRTVQAVAQDRAAGNAQAVLASSNDRFAKGTASYFQVVTDQATLLSTQLSAAQTFNARLAATVDLVRAVGGQWPTVDPAAAGPTPPRRARATR